MRRGWEVWLDGGHNAAAGEVLGARPRIWRDQPLHLVVGMLNTKDAAGFLAPLAPYAQSLYAVTDSGRGEPAARRQDRRGRARGRDAAAEASTSIARCERSTAAGIADGC